MNLLSQSVEINRQIINLELRTLSACLFFVRIAQKQYKIGIHYGHGSPF